MALYSSSLAAMVWAAWPLHRRPWTALIRAGAALALFAVVSITSYFYSWHLRPNLGLYREAGWVAQHPGFQRQLRQRIETNLWRKRSRVPQKGLLRLLHLLRLGCPRKMSKHSMPEDFDH